MSRAYVPREIGCSLPQLDFLGSRGTRFVVPKLKSPIGSVVVSDPIQHGLSCTYSPNPDHYTRVSVHLSK